jgi:type IV pilus assembly protein PilV
LTCGGRPNQQGGFGLIESLVAALLLSIGLYAMLALHNASLREGKNAQHALAASQLMTDLSNRVRANPAAARAGWYTTNAYQSIAVTPFNPNCARPNANCTAQQMAAFDLAQWRNLVALALPAAGWQMNAASSEGVTHFDLWLAWQVPQDNKTAAVGSACPDSIKALLLNSQCAYLKVVS